MILFEYQKTAIEWLTSRKHALLALDMGLGKTAICIKACDELKVNRILVIAPAVTRENWVREFAKFSDNPRIFEVIKSYEQLEKSADFNHVIISYNLITERNELFRRKWDVIICDECHYLKSGIAKRTKAILGSNGLIHNSDRFWGLSGTPMPNNPSELWPLLFTLRATRIKFKEFVATFCTGYEGDFGFVITGANQDNLPKLKKMLDTIMLRYTKEDVMPGLPTLTYEEVMVKPTKLDFGLIPDFIRYENNSDELYERLENEKFLLTEMFKTAGLGQDSFNMLSGIYSHVATLRRFTGCQKIQEVVKLVTKELRADEYKKIVIFGIHKDVICILRDKLKKEFKAVLLFGGTDPDTRTKNIDKFQNDKNCRVFVGNIHAAGIGITLTAASEVLFIEQDWVPGNNAQAIMRCHRIGQDRNVRVRFVALEDSLDQRITRAVKNKTRDITQLFGN